MTKNKKNQITLNITIDLDEIKKHVKEYADENGLESSGGLTPIDLAQAWEEMETYLPNSPLTQAFTQIINILQDIHEESTDNNEPTDD